MTGRARRRPRALDAGAPTLRYLTDGLGLKIPPINDPLDELDHPLLRKANQQFAGSVPKNLLLAILDMVPGCDRNAWFPELAMPHRVLEPGEQAGRS